MDLKISAQEGIDKIKKLLFGELDPANAPATTPTDAQAFEMVEYKLLDGTPVMIDKLAEGGQVLVADSPAPDGEHTLEDGTVLSTLNGLIASITPKLEDEVVAEPLEASKEYMSKADFDNFKNEILSRFSKQDKANKENVKVLENILKFEVEAPIKKAVDFDSLTPLQKFRVSK